MQSDPRLVLLLGRMIAKHVEVRGAEPISIHVVLADHPKWVPVDPEDPAIVIEYVQDGATMLHNARPR